MGNDFAWRVRRNVAVPQFPNGMFYVYRSSITNTGDFNFIFGWRERVDFGTKAWRGEIL